MFGMNVIDPSSGFEYGWIGLKNIRQLILPIVVISTAGFASQMRFSRAQAIEQANQEYVKTAHAKGASEMQVLFKHIFRVALVPLSTILVGDVLLFILSGSLIIETIFQIPGLGLIGYRALTSTPDTAVVMATSLIPIFLAVIGYLLQDLAYVALDPRISYGDR
jgi:peptide/nickel transport system permease protein